MGRELRTLLLTRLREAGVSRVTCDYCGSNDEGWLETPHFYNATDQRIPVPAGDKLANDVQTFFDGIVEANYPGWEINDGGSGDFNWILAEDKLKHVHHTNFMQTDTEESDL